jgi:tetratricopeptide (TPR) repeat protein
VAVDYNLESLSEADTQAYIRHRIRIAGGTHPLFTDQACALGYRLTTGNPRLINQVCDTALAYGFAEQSAWITARLLGQAAADRSRGGLLPLKDADTAGSLNQDQEESEQRQMASGPATPPCEGPSPGPMHRTLHTDPYERGLALKTAGRYREAMEQFKVAAEDEPHCFRARAQIGLCLTACGRIDEAVVAFQNALQTPGVASNDALQVRYLLGRTSESLGRVSDALEAYRRIHRDAPGFKDVAARVGRLCSRRSRDDRPRSGANGSWVREVTRRWQYLLRSPR